MFRTHRSSSLSSTASTANPAVSSVASSGGTLDRSATLSSLSVRSIAVSASGQQKKDRPAWERLARKLSQALGVKPKKNLLALPPVEEDPAFRKQARLPATSIAVSDALVSSQAHSSAEGCNSEASVCERAEETELVSRTKSLSNAARQRESASPALLELIDAIPADLPLIRYIAECLLTDAPSSSSPHDERSKDVESQLFLMSLELKKWTLAQVLAVKIQRRIAFRHQHRIKDDTTDEEADKERIQLGSSAIIEHEVDGCDVILSFLDTCSA